MSETLVLGYYSTAPSRPRGADMPSGRHLIAAAALIYVGVMASRCSSTKPAPAPPAAPAPVRTEMKAVVSVKELMRFTIDPLADNIFDAVSWDITRKGIKETVPRSDEDWEKVKIGAVTLAESIYLLKLPRPFAHSG